MSTIRQSNLSRLTVWLKAIRAPFFTATIIPVALGAAIAWYDRGSFAWMRFWLTMAGALLMHTGTNLTNDYFDHLSGCDEANANPTPFSGGSRIIQEGLIAPKKILCAALLSFSIGSGIGLYLNYVCRGNVILFLGIIGLFLGFFYTAKPFRIGYGRLGEVAVGVGFGPVMVAGAYYVQAAVLPFKVFMIAMPIAILVALILFINEFPDYHADKSVGKRNAVVILGKKRAIVVYHVLLASVYAWIVVLAAVRLIPALCLISLLTFPLALKAYTASEKNYNKIYELLPANASTIGLHFLIGLLLCLGFLAARIA